MECRKELVSAFMDMFQLMSAKVQETDQSCLAIVTANDITKADLALIAYIGRQQEVIMREVAEYLSVPYSTATGVVDKLVQKKMLMRVNSEEDRRIVKVCLTPEKGKEILEQFTNFRNKLGAMMLQDLDEKDFEDIERIMKKMHRQISNENICSELTRQVS